MYGKELILDLHGCDPRTFTRHSITAFFAELCELIDMEACDAHFWDYEDCPEEYGLAPDHLKGISAIQFISTSNITIHTLDVLKQVYVNLFSCKEFDSEIASEFVASWFDGNIVNKKEMERI